ncbi:hypothetical protein A2U01_0063892, partial [Trifolium medium]|nr:hypothetical protein [Trifolium medium]
KETVGGFLVIEKRVLGKVLGQRGWS